MPTQEWEAEVDVRRRGLGERFFRIRMMRSDQQAARGRGEQHSGSLSGDRMGLIRHFLPSDPVHDTYTMEQSTRDGKPVVRVTKSRDVMYSSVEYVIDAQTGGILFVTD